MKTLLFVLCFLLINIAVESNKIDSKLLRCLVCRATVNEIQGEIAKINPAHEIEVGNYRIDAQGNSVRKKIPLAQSEVHISDMLDNICEKMSDYVRATYKSNGQLTLLNLMTSTGGVNPEISKVDIVQDGDLNKSLQYYCDGIVEEYEDSIISLFARKEDNIKRQLCTKIANLCDATDFNEEDNEDAEESDNDEEHEEL